MATARDPARLTVDDVKSLPLFAGVSLDALAAAFSRPSLRTFMPDELLFHKGDPASGFFVILNGHVSVELDGTYLVPRGEHELIGEQAMLAADSRRTATVTACSLVTALWVSRDVFDRLTRDPQFSLNLARALSNKLTQATTDRAFRYSKEALVFGEFRAHVAPEVLDQLIQDGAAYGNPRNAEAIVLFSDIRSFTERSSAMPPDQIAAELTTYLNHVVDLVHKHGGLVDKFVGDAVMVVWGAFEDLGPVHSRQAFDCARRMVESAKSFTFGGLPIEIGVGLNAGRVFVGNVGGNGKRQFTVLGASVNLASRFEAKTKELGSPIVLGEAMARLLPPEMRAVLREHVDVVIKGAARQRLFSFDPLARVIERSTSQ